MQEKAREWWESWSAEFQELHEGPAIAFGPGAPPGDDLGLLGDVAGERVVELGCGGGQFGLALAERGGTVTGVDISPAQLSHARELADRRDQEIELIEASVTAVPIRDGSFDLAVSAFAFQWVEDLDACFEEAHRVLRSDGRFVFSVPHPYYKIVDSESHEFTASYFTDEPRREYSEKLDAELVIHRRTVSDIFTHLRDAGFAVTTMEEPGYEDPEEYDNDSLSNDPELMAKVPPTIVFAAEKHRNDS